MLYIDLKFASILGSRLSGFALKGNNKSNFAHTCERSDSNKRRGWFLPFKNSLFFKCHHCGASSKFETFLKESDPTLYSEYRIEKLKEKAGQSTGTFLDLVVPSVDKKPDVDLFGLTPIEELAKSNPARLYVERRKIPQDQIGRLFLAKRFNAWASKHDERFLDKKSELPRLVIPIYDRDKKLNGFTCRAFGPEQPKYIHLKIDKASDFIFGLDRLDFSKPIIAVEGQIDSLFLTNAIAVGSANYKAPFLEQFKDRIIIVPDNDFRRNPQVCQQLKRAIELGFAVSLLPANWKKDINDIVKSGILASEINQYIISHQKSGMAALLELTLEKKC